MTHGSGACDEQFTGYLSVYRPFVCLLKMCSYGSHAITVMDISKQTYVSILIQPIDISKQTYVSILIQRIDISHNFLVAEI
jgi:hypothetical protein